MPRSIGWSDAGEVMLGIKFLKDHNAVWDFGAGEVVLDGGLCGRGQRLWCRRVILQQDVLIPPNSELDLPMLTQFSSFNSSPGEEASWVIGTREMRPGVRVSRTVVPDGSRISQFVLST